MTYCVGLKIDRGLVFMSDTRTNAGVDSISTFRKMHVWEEPGERVIVHASPAKNGDPEGIIARVTKADGSILGNQPNFNRAAEVSAARPAEAPAPVRGERPNFAGVYYPAQQGGQAPPPREPGRPLPPPTRSSPTSDGSQGRGADAPKLTPAYLEKWNVIAASRTSGSY